MRPNFLHIGPGRTGSKWLHRVMKAHPNIFVPRIADLYFFDRPENFSKGLDWYLGYFSKADSDLHKAIGELSHDYIFSIEAAKRIKEFNSEMKLLVTVRNPIELAYSQYISDLNAGFVSVTFEEALRSEPKYVYECSYSNFLGIYFDLFGFDNILILDFEVLQDDPSNYLEAVCNFLDVPILPELSEMPVFNKSAKPRSPFIGVLAKRCADFLRHCGLNTLLGVIKSNRPMRSILFKDRAEISYDHFKILNDRYFRTEQEYLERLLQKGISHWYKSE